MGLFDLVLFFACCTQSLMLACIVLRVAYVEIHNHYVMRKALNMTGGYGWCMCGDRIDNHGYASNHNPVDMVDYYTDQRLIKNY